MNGDAMAGVSGNSQYGANRFSWGKLAFLGLMTYVLSSVSFLLPLAPVPLAMAVLLYGRPQGVGLVAACLGLAYGVGVIFPSVPYSIPNVILASAVAFAVSQVVLTKTHPIEGLVKSGAGLFFLALMSFGAFHLVYEGGIYQGVMDAVQNFVQTVESSPNKEEFLSSDQPYAKMVNYLINNPDETVRAVLSWSFAVSFVFIFLAVWIALLLVLRNSPVWRQKVSYPFTSKDLLRFRMPDATAWPLIAGLALYVGGEYVMQARVAEVMGGNILMLLAVFYFFQGVGIYLDTLDYFRIYGFLRSILVVVVVIFAWEIVVIGGVFDMWINFRKWLTKKDEGDKS